MAQSQEDAAVSAVADEQVGILEEKVEIDEVLDDHVRLGVAPAKLVGAVMGLDEPVGPEDAPWYRAFEAEPDPRRALKILVENTTLILRRVGPLTAAINAAANDPEVAAVRDLGEQRLHEGYRAIVRMLARKGGLRQGLTMGRATDILFVLLSPALFDALASGRGWSLAECTRWLVEVLSQQLLPGA